MAAKLGVRKLTERQSELLRALRCEGPRATFDGPVIPDWKVLTQAMLLLGSKWQRGAFVFDTDVMAEDVIGHAIETGEVLDPRKADFFATPASLVERVIALAELDEREGLTVLEPSAGDGRIARAALEHTPYVTCVEHFEKNFKILLRDIFGVVPGSHVELFGEDFLRFARERQGQFDRVIMNPPFSKRAWISHIGAAFTLVKPGGILVAIAPSSFEHDETKAARALRAELKSGGVLLVERNEDGAFAESGTNVRTVTLRAKKLR